MKSYVCDAQNQVLAIFLWLDRMYSFIAMVPLACDAQNHFYPWFCWLDRYGRMDSVETIDTTVNGASKSTKGAREGLQHGPTPCPPSI
jgi:hypothetical protein